MIRDLTHKGVKMRVTEPYNEELHGLNILARILAYYHIRKKAKFKLNNTKKGNKKDTVKENTTT